MKLSTLVVLLTAAINSSSFGVIAQAQKPGIGVEELGRLDTLPQFKSSVKVASISSFDRTGGNDDGFSGKYSFVRKEGDGLVIADLKGPGCIYRIWTPTPTDDSIEFYFDGEEKPRLAMKYRQLFDGGDAPFKPPFSGFGSGGFYCYIPMPYKVSCKVIIRAPKVQFYQINYATYAEGTSVNTFSPSDTGYSASKMERAKQIYSSSGQDISRFVSPAGAKFLSTRINASVRPNTSATLFQSATGGRVVGIKISPASALAGKDRAITLKMYWDGSSKPAVNCPAGDFFGYSWGTPAARSLMIGYENNTAYAYFPMPYEKSAKIVLTNDRSNGAPLQIQAEVITANTPKAKNEGRFYAVWHRENPTTEGRPFNYVTTEGRGHMVGLTLQAQGATPGSTPFFEGDDQAWLDGELAIHGTGSEDFFNGGWYDVPGRWEGRASYHLSGCLDYIRPQARSGAYRLFLTDAYSFQKSLKMDMEHAPEKNTYVADYVGVTYLYLEKPVTTNYDLPTVAKRTVTDPSRLIFNPGWYLPIHSFSIEHASLTKKVERIGKTTERFVSLRGENKDIFGDHHISFLCSVPAAGKYKVIIEAIEGPEGGIVQLFQNEHAVGTATDLFAASQKKSDPITMGELDLQEGPNQVFFKLIGKNDMAKAQGLDLVTITLERVKN